MTNADGSRPIEHFYAATTRKPSDRAFLCTKSLRLGRREACEARARPPRLQTPAALPLLLREEVEQPNNAQVGDYPQQKRDDQRHKRKVGAGQNQGNDQSNYLKP